MLSWLVMAESTESLASWVASRAESEAAKAGTATSAFAFCFCAEALSEAASMRAEMQICDNFKFTFYSSKSCRNNLVPVFSVETILFLFQFIENIHDVLQLLFIGEGDADLSLALG